MLPGESNVDMEKNVFVNFALKPHDFYNFRRKNCKKGVETGHSLQFRAVGTARAWTGRAYSGLYPEVWTVPEASLRP